jgi:hypothetical protein
VKWFVTARHPTFERLQTYVKHAPSGGSAVSTVGMQQHPLDSCNVQQDRNFRLLQGIAGHAEVSIAVAHHVVADGNDSSLPMALISAVCATCNACMQEKLKEGFQALLRN